MDNSPFAWWRWVDVFKHIDIFVQGFEQTLLISFLALLISIVMGIMHALMATSKFRILKLWARVYVEFFQNTPLLINLFFLYFVLPKVPYIGITLDVFMIGVLGIGVYHGAYMSEVIRSGIESIPKGQFEAAATQGFNYIQKMVYIILPQTIKIILPPSTNQAVNLIKNTSVLMVISGAEIMYRTDSYAQETLNYAPAYIVAGIFYFVVCYLIAYITTCYENKLKKAHLER